MSNIPILNMERYQEKEILSLKRDVNNLKEIGVNPKLVILTDGKDERCKSYMKSKIKYGELVGVEVIVREIEDVLDLTSVLQVCYQENIPTIMQLPISKEYLELYENNLLVKKLDVDGFFSYNELVQEEWDNAPCTAKGIMNYILDSEGLDLDVKGKFVVLMGYGNLTNKPLSIMLATSKSTCVNINSSTDYFLRKELLRRADIVICSTGVKGSVKTSELNRDKDVYVFNVGTIIDENGKLDTEVMIDSDNENVYTTNRIKAVGVLTVLSLIDNVISYYKRVN